MVSLGDKIVGNLSSDPRGFALSLHSKSFISDAILEETNQLNETDTVKAQRLYSAVLTVMRSYPHRYDEFVLYFRRKGNFMMTC